MGQADQLFDLEQEMLEAQCRDELKMALLDLLQSDSQVKKAVVNIAMRAPNIMSQY